MKIVSSTEAQNNFGRYLKLAEEGEIIMITKNGKEVARLCSVDQSKTIGFQSMKGIFKKELSEEEIKLGRLAKYENMD